MRRRSVPSLARPNTTIVSTTDLGKVNHDDAVHQFSVVVDGHRGVLDYTLTGRVMRITHTGVPPEIGGKGVAASLMKAAADTAQTHGWSIDPVCSYAIAYLARHPQAATIYRGE